jgi:NAD(P)-dependent dehydrogenase (short-subunit alcohol dehydrogenase family)
VSRRYPPIDLADATVVVTGGARGIGLATARRFAGQGSRVAIGDLDVDVAKTEAGALSTPVAGRGTVTAHALDVTSAASFTAFLDEVRAAHGPVDVLVNNAGIMPVGAFTDMPGATHERILDVNVLGVVHGMQAVLPEMIERGRGHVVNVASLFGRVAMPGFATYNASKFAVVGLTSATRQELDRSGVSVSAVLPSAVDTELVAGLSFDPLPVIDPVRIAEAVVRSVRTRRGQIAVPGYMNALVSVSNALPEPVRRGVSRLVRGDRGLTDLDADARAAYVARTTGRT